MDIYLEKTVSIDDLAYSLLEILKISKEELEVKFDDSHVVENKGYKVFATVSKLEKGFPLYVELFLNVENQEFLLSDKEIAVQMAKYLNCNVFLYDPEVSGEYDFLAQPNTELKKVNLDLDLYEEGYIKIEKILE